MTKNITHQSKMKFYSVDLRQKIINVYETEPISQRQLAKRFCVALSFVQKLLKLSPSNPRYFSSNSSMFWSTETEFRTTGNFSPIDWYFGRCYSRRTLRITPRKNRCYCQPSHNGKNDPTVENHFQKKTLFPSAKGSERVQNLRYEFWKQVNNLNVQDLIFID